MRTIAFAGLALAACTPAARPGSGAEQVAVTNLTSLPEPIATADTGASCDAGKVQDVVGKLRTDALAEDARVRSGARAVRTITPGMMVTMDYREDRLNLHVGTDHRIDSARCG